MSKQTAIHQAINRIKELQNSLTSSSQKLGLAQAMDILEDYKEIEKQQIIDACDQIEVIGLDHELPGEKYYNETFNK